ncbi:hypothetical protein C7121_14315 [Paenibacillus glucanolyticus]|nr:MULTISPECIES: hypothetical protein [Paenibacillus]ANA78884.1 hypothetical protein A3958_02215 [Paenibacillus glucanolyticus]AVV57201.1 hypothetical protein C7121_14315 [Paenibacillus glucanolyticus]
MVNFIAQGMAIGIYGKMTDLSGSAIPAWNPLFGSPATRGLDLQQYLVRAGGLTSYQLRPLLFRIRQTPPR